MCRHFLVFEEILRPLTLGSSIVIALTTTVLEIGIKLATELTFASVATAFALTAEVFVRLEDAAITTEGFHLSAESDKSADLAVKSAVLQGNALRRLQSESIEECLLAADNPCLISRKIVLEFAAKRTVDGGNVLGMQALAVGRVGNHQTTGLLTSLGNFGKGKVADVALLHGDIVSHAGSLHVFEGGPYGIVIEVVAINMVIEFAFLAVIIVDFGQKVGIEILPILKSETFTEDSGMDIAGHQCRFDKESTATAEGVDNVAVELPAAHLDDCSCKHLIDGCFDGSFTVSTQMQAFAARVERKGTYVLCDVDVEAKLRICHADIGTLPFALHEIVHNGILYLVGDEAGVAESGAVDGSIDGE